MVKNIIIARNCLIFSYQTCCFTRTCNSVFWKVMKVFDISITIIVISISIYLPLNILSVVLTNNKTRKIKEMSPTEIVLPLKMINIKHNLFKVKQNIKSILKYLIHCAWMYFSEDETFKSSKTD